MLNRFFQVTLRTLGVDAARAFYESVLGPTALEIVELHEQAVARGARPHWLGFIQVDDVSRVSAAFVARGAQELARWVNPLGLEAAVIRDPGGALLALGKPAQDSPVATPEIAWHALNTHDVERARANYTELFGWNFHAQVDLAVMGVFHPFSYARGAQPVGSFGDVSTRPSVHTHWLFHFRVPNLELALKAVRAGGGKALDPVTLVATEGRGAVRVAACDDPQGAAFALLQAL